MKGVRTENTVSLKKASTYYLIGSFFKQGIAFLTVPVFTRILSVDDYGIVVTYNSWVAIATMIISFALYMAVRAAFVDYKDNVPDFLSTTVTFSALYGIVILGGTILVVSLTKINISLILIVLCFLQSISTALIEEYLMYLMMTYRYKARTAFMVLPNLISTLVALAIILYIKNVKPEEHLYMGRIVPNAFVTLIFGLIVVFLTYHKRKPSLKKEYLVYGLKISAPLVLHGIALNILSQSDRTMITVYRNSYETGIYGLIYNFSMVATVLTTALEGLWIPWFTRKMMKKEYQEINQMSKHYIHFMMMALVGVMLVGSEIVHIMAPENYWEGIKMIPPLVVSNFVIFCYTLFVNVEHFYKKTIFISVNTGIAAIANIILNIIFIQKWGYTGAAYSTLLSYLVSFVLHTIYSKKLNKELYGFRLFLIPYLIVLFSIVVFYVFENLMLVRWGIAFVLVVFYVIWEKDLIFKIIKR